jgi:hypothetical protein
MTPFPISNLIIKFTVRLLKAKADLHKLTVKRDSFPNRASKLRQPIRRLKAFIRKLEARLGNTQLPGFSKANCSLHFKKIN